MTTLSPVMARGVVPRSSLSLFAGTLCLAGLVVGCEPVDSAVESEEVLARGPASITSEMSGEMVPITNIPGSEVVPGQYIIVFHPDLFMDSLGEDPHQMASRIATEVGGEVGRSWRHVVQGFSMTASDEVLRRLQMRPEVKRIEPVIVTHLSGSQSSPPWGLDRIDERSSDSDNTYYYAGKGVGVHAYIIDSGIRETHDEFAGRIGNGQEFIGDGNGRNDCNGHGTNVASIVGGTTYGVAKGVTLHTVRVATCAGSVSSSDYVSGLDWVAANHISPAVANISLRFGASTTIDDATTSLVKFGVTTVVAAGNDNDDACDYSPARVDRVLTVGNINTSDARYVNPSDSTDGSNFGSCLDLFAPGTSILGAGIASNTSTATWTGTSQASPHVAGVAALYLSDHPLAIPSEVNNVIIGHASSGEVTSAGTGSPNLVLYSLPGENFGTSVARGDFNNDGRDDLAVGIPGWDSSTEVDVGKVEIYHGTSSGFASSPTSSFEQDTTGVIDTSEAGDRFGAALVVGDFDGDNYDDLAIGTPGEDVSSADDAGSVHILYGSSTGLVTTGNQRWTQDSTDIQGDSEEGDHFGIALASADFDNDGYADLAVGMPGDSINGDDNAGAVGVIYGTSSGLAATGNQRWHEDNGSIPGDSEAGDQFGVTLAAGDLDNDNYADLVIGVPFDDFNSTENSGRFVVLYSTSSGLSASGSEGWHQDTTNIEGALESGDVFASALAIGDFDSDGSADVAVGVPGEDVGSEVDAGGVNIIFGSTSGLTATGDQIWTQDSTSVPGVAEDTDRFGASLAVGELNSGSYDDLLIGVPGENVDSIKKAGAVNIMLGSSSGLTTTSSQIWTQDSTDITDVAESRDQMGHSLCSGDFDGDGYDDMAAGVPWEDTSGTSEDDGAVNVIYSISSGLSATGDEMLY